MNKEEFLKHYLTANLDPRVNRREYIRKHIPEKLYWRDPYNGEEHNVRELLVSESMFETELIVQTLHDVIVDGAKAFVCAREASNLVTGVQNPYKFPLGGAFTYAEKVAEGAEIPDYDEPFSYKLFEADKFALKARISTEMIEDCKVDVVVKQLKYLGEACENMLNKQWLTQALDNAGNEHDTGGSNQGIKAIIKAKAEVETDGFRPDTLVMHPEAKAVVFSDIATAYNASWAQMLETGQLGDIMGLKPYVLSTAEDSSSYTWSYGSDSEIGMLVLSREFGMGCVIFDDITVERFKDPIHDLVALPVKMRAKADYLHANAICRVEY